MKTRIQRRNSKSVSRLYETFIPLRTYRDTGPVPVHRVSVIEDGSEDDPRYPLPVSSVLRSYGSSRPVRSVSPWTHEHSKVLSCLCNPTKTLLDRAGPGTSHLFQSPRCLPTSPGGPRVVRESRRPPPNQSRTHPLLRPDVSPLDPDDPPRGGRGTTFTDQTRPLGRERTRTTPKYAVTF